MLIRITISLLILLTAIVSAQAGDVDVYILTGQSNSLGTTNLESAGFAPGTHPADAQTNFFWSNVNASNTAYPPLLYGDSGGAITTLQVQQGFSPSPNFWGPEFGFARNLLTVGDTEVMVIKASRGGGGNGFWDRATFDGNNNGGHMWGHLRDTVDSALSNVVSNGDSFNVRGLMYLQGESNNSSGAAVAGQLLDDLIGNLQSHINTQYPNAADDLFSVIGEIAASNSNANRSLTTQQQMQLAAGSNTIDFVSTRDLPLKSDGIHFGRDAKLAIGQRFAQAFNINNGSPGLNRIAGYVANLDEPGPILSPTTQGMQAIGGTVPGVTLEAIDDDGTRAWQVLNNSRSAIPGYQQSVSPAHFDRMFADGWSFKATAKVISGGGQAFWSLSQQNDPGWRLTETLNTNGFVLNRVNGDELEVTLLSDPTSINLGPGSADEYHSFELLGETGSSLFDFYIDDILHSAGNDLRDGSGSANFQNKLVFNSGLGTGREVYWNEVSLTTVPEPTSCFLLAVSQVLLLSFRRRHC